MPNDWEQTAQDMAEAHVNWLLKMLKPLLVDHMVHGFKHGRAFKNTPPAFQPLTADSKVISTSDDAKNPYQTVATDRS